MASTDFTVQAFMDMKQNSRPLARYRPGRLRDSANSVERCSMKYQVTVAGRIFEGSDVRRLLAEAVRAWKLARAKAASSAA